MFPPQKYNSKRIAHDFISAEHPPQRQAASGNAGHGHPRDSSASNAGHAGGAHASHAGGSGGANASRAGQLGREATSQVRQSRGAHSSQAGYSGGAVASQAGRSGRAYTSQAGPSGLTGHSSQTHNIEDRGDRGNSGSKNLMQKASDKKIDKVNKSSKQKSTDLPRSDEQRTKETKREKTEASESVTKAKSASASTTKTVIITSGEYPKRPVSVASSGSKSVWSEHISSTGKKYYYNCITEVSQWERPRETELRRSSYHEPHHSSSSGRDKRPSSHSGAAPEQHERGDGVGRARAHKRSHSHDRPDSRYGSTEREYSRRLPYGPDFVIDHSDKKKNERKQSQPRSATTHTATSSTATATVTSAMACGSREGRTPTPSRMPTPTATCAPGPPTPTQDAAEPSTSQAYPGQPLPRKMPSLGMYSAVVGTTPVDAPMLSPSLRAYVRQDLVAHVANWPADDIERQADKCRKEAHLLSCLLCTNVAVELKVARAVVRHNEILSTLQDQKALYLRQQIGRLVGMKTITPFMWDE